MQFQFLQQISATPFVSAFTLHTKHLCLLGFKSPERCRVCFKHLCVWMCLLLHADLHQLGGRQAGVCSEGRDWRERLDPLDGGKRASSGEKTSAPGMNINLSNLDSLIHIQNASQRSMWSAFSCVIPAWINSHWLWVEHVDENIYLLCLYIWGRNWLKWSLNTF